MNNEKLDELVKKIRSDGEGQHGCSMVDVETLIAHTLDLRQTLILVGRLCLAILDGKV